MKFAAIASLILILVMNTKVANAQAEIGYLSLEPEIVTNYTGSTAKKLGYVRVSIELMIHDLDQLEIAEHHLPLLRATAIEIFGNQPEDKVKSLTGREDIRLSIKTKLQELMTQETGSEIVKDVIFTKYLQQG
ncbi:flagellar basal body-associated protein FliL [Alteromonas sp. 5E99-2]|nr:flagellar basal body-associated protein FliL [Alteromonas sp. 5E99-2]